MTNHYRKLFQRPRLADVLQYLTGTMTPDEIHWFLAWSEHDADLSRWLALFETSAMSDESPLPHPGRLSPTEREDLSTVLSELAHSQIAAVRTPSAAVRLLADNQPVECSIAGFGGAICSFVPGGDGTSLVEFRGLPSHVQPVQFVLSSVGIPPDAPLAMTPVTFDNIIWPDELLDGPPSEEIANEESFELAISFATAEERDLHSLLTVDQIGERTIRFMAHAREGERCRPIRVIFEYPADPSKTSQALVQYGPIYSVLKPRFDSSELASTLDVPLPANAAIGPVTVHARTITDRELKNLPPPEASVVLGHGTARAIRFGKEIAPRAAVDPAVNQREYSSSSYQVMLDDASITELENGNLTFILQYVDARKLKTKALPSIPNLTPEQQEILDWALKIQAKAMQYLKRFRFDSLATEGIFFDSLMIAFENSHQLRTRNQVGFASWFMRILFNEACKRWREQERQGHSLDQPRDLENEETSWAVQILDRRELKPEELIQREEDRRTVQQLISQLSPRHQEALTLKYFRELPNPEIAEYWGINTNDAAQRIFRAKEAITELLRKSFGDQGAAL